MAVAALAAAACTGSAATSGGSGASGSAPSHAPGAPVDPEAGIMNLDHLIFIVQENRSFDHYFGSFPGADGIPVDDQGEPTVCAQDPVLDRCVPPYRTTELVNLGGPHNHEASVLCVGDGAMVGFIEAAAGRACIRDRDASRCGPSFGPDGQPDIMSYHDDRTIP
ncbi:MAG: alkaline phosphatase family protein, partial [Actinomycetota bacterium]